MASDSNKKLQFVPFSSMVSPGFWYQLVEKKLNVFKLDCSSIQVKGFYSNSEASGVPCQHCVEYDSFEDDPTPSIYCSTLGHLYNTNTLEDFKEYDKKKLLQKEAEILWDDITSGKAITNPKLMAKFFLLSFADLKKYQFCYWFGFPSFLKVTDNFSVKTCCMLQNVISDEKMSLLDEKVKCYVEYKGFFILSCDDSSFKGPTFHQLTELPSLVSAGRYICFIFSDPSTLPGYPGWPLRNFLLLIRLHWGKMLDGTVNLIGLRCKSDKGIRTISSSLWLKLSYDIKDLAITVMPNAVGWEKNQHNKLTPRQVNLSESMDPKRLAESAVSLNLKLMRWRLMPNIDLEKISQAKCLLLGAGTLGCNVARGLLGWGVKKITLVDNGRVSFSNPVRQTLFEFSDCSTSGGRSKAEAAAERLLKIFPGVDALGVELSIPMPGHPVDTNETTLQKAKNDVKRLIDLIDSHDAIFLLMDTRESRWLPTLLAGSKKKLVINAALGFDSYLVMRHGVLNCSKESNGSGPSSKLGCYYCNDVVAPGNSLKDRTLDQQCTVSRPGISMIASAIAVELFVSVIQHDEGAAYLPSYDDDGDDSHDSSRGLSFGLIPHQIRGYISNFQTLLPSTFAFSKCTACSQIVLDKFEESGMDFLLEVFNSPPKYLEDLTGLTQLHQETAAAEDDIIELSDCESF